MKEVKLSPEEISDQEGWITGYNGAAKVDNKLNLATNLGCTLAGHSAMSNLSTVRDAMAVRIAASRPNPYATYVIGNLARPDRERGSTALRALLRAGWKVIAVMDGAHGNYRSFLMGASTAKSEEELLDIIEAEKSIKHCLPLKELLG